MLPLLQVSRLPLSRLMPFLPKNQSFAFLFPAVPQATGSLQSRWSRLSLVSQSADPSSQQWWQAQERLPRAACPEHHPRYQLRVQHVPGLEGMLRESLPGTETFSVPVESWQQEHLSWCSLSGFTAV